MSDRPTIETIAPSITPCSKLTLSAGAFERARAGPISSAVVAAAANVIDQGGSLWLAIQTPTLPESRTAKKAATPAACAQVLVAPSSDLVQMSPQ